METGQISRESEWELGNGSQREPVSAFPRFTGRGLCWFQIIEMAEALEQRKLQTEQLEVTVDKVVQTSFVFVIINFICFQHCYIFTCQTIFGKYPITSSS